MATDTRSTTRLSPASKPNHQQRMVEERITAARRQLRLVDLASGMVLLAISLLGYFLLLALIEHWIVPLGSIARYAAWLTLLVAGGYFLVARLLPAIIRPINPIYAARAIEGADPSLKNSLINFLLFRQRRQELREVVYQALEQQAAEGAARVSLEAVVDRSGLIKLGYVLAASLALFATYELASPKAAMQTVRRVMLPWANIAPPTRVAISEVKPGNGEAYRGFAVKVTADIRGLREGEAATLLYSTADGQITNHPVPLAPVSEVPLQFMALLPEQGGLSQDMHYRLEAGDATSPEFTLVALAEPTVIVTRVEYQPPSYTGRQPWVVEATGDLKALEQTVVTIHAQANYPLQDAAVAFDPDTTAKPRQVRAKVEGDTVRVSFPLELTADRQGAKHRTYQLQITTSQGVTNAQPILHTMEVVPDLAPEVQILVPEARRMELPQDGQQPLQARAIDPDFGLSAFSLRATVGGKPLFNESLLAGDAQPRQHRGEYLFQPGKLGLPVGSEVLIWAEAADNRTLSPQGSPEPNTAKTEQYRIRITPPVNPPQQEPNEGAGQQPNEQGNPQNQPNEADPNAPAESGEQAGEQGNKAGSEGKEGDSGEESSEAEGENGAGRGGESQQEGELGDGSGDERTGNGSNPNGPEGGDQNGAGGNQALGEGGTKPGDQTGGNQGESGGSEPGGPSQPSEKQGDTGEPAESPQEGGGGENSRPLNADGTEDADAFERIQDFLEQQGKQNGTEAGEQQGSPQSNGAGDDTGDTNKPGEPKANQGDPAEKKPGGEGSDTKPGEQKNATSPEPGGKPQGADDQRPEQGTGNEAPSKRENRNGGQGTTGESGAGKPGEKESQGAPEAQGENRDSPKNKPESGQGKEPNETAQSPSVSNKQSDSEGEQGDRSGGGGEGGGQAAKQEGNDSPGSTTAADEGASAASESGEGETGEGAGNKATSEGETGQQGEEQGGGSRTRPGEEGAPPGEGQTNNQESGEASSKPADPANTGGQAEGEPGSSPMRAGGGQPGRGNLENREFDDAPAADEVNLEYARKATNLVLDKLQQQAEQPNEELLNQLGWTPEQLQQFVKRWQAMKQQSQQQGAAGEAAREELDAALQSLGLSPEASRRMESSADAVGGARDAGFRSQPPPGYQRLYDAFRKSGE